MIGHRLKLPPLDSRDEGSDKTGCHPDTKLQTHQKNGKESLKLQTLVQKEANLRAVCAYLSPSKTNQKSVPFCHETFFKNPYVSNCY
jgi:hypothetical protein